MSNIIITKTLVIYVKNIFLALGFIKMKTRNRIYTGPDSFQVRSRQTETSGMGVQWQSG